MSDCSRLMELLTEYLEGRLPLERQGELERHLSACPECVGFVRTFRSTVSMLQSLSDDDLPEELRLRLRSFLDGSTKN